LRTKALPYRITKRGLFKFEYELGNTKWRRKHLKNRVLSELEIGKDYQDDILRFSSKSTIFADTG